jgi:hypothetical protein
MVDEIANSTPTSTASPAATVAEAVVSTPVTEVSSVAPAVVQAPVEAAHAVVEAPKQEILLAQKPVEEKPVEAKAEVKTEEAPVEVKTEEAVIEQPKYEFKFPEGVTVDDAKIGDFTQMLGEFETTAKVPHEEVQKLGQQMVERHIAEVQRYTESLTQAWEKQANDWKDSFLKSPEFANRTDTVLRSAQNAIDTFSGDAKNAQEFRDLMESSKVGNHPAMIRLLSNVMLAKAEGKPLAAPQIATPARESKITKMYGKKS